MSFGVRRRARRIDQYTQVDNAFLRDTALSIEARGLGAYLLSNAEGFRVSAAQLAAVCGTGRDKTRRILKELEDAGYLLREQTRDDGKFAEDEFSMSDEKTTSEPVTENPSTENQGLVIAPHKKTIQKTNLEEDQLELMSGQPDDAAETETDPQEKRKDGLTLPVLDAEFDDWYEQYPRKEGKGQARLKYRQARRAGVKAETLDAGVLEYVARLKRDGTPKTYTKLPGTWLNGECWLDEDVVRRDVAPVRAAPVRSGDPDKFAGIPVGTLLNP